jgi:PBSX family phage terminase large subunit
MLLHPAQIEIARDRHRFRVVNCGRRFGKTTLAVEEIKGKMVYTAKRCAYIAPTYQQARDIAWATIKKELSPVAKNINESRLELITHTRDGGESILVLRAWEAIETLRGQAFDFIVIDEVASMRNFWSAWYEVIRPTLLDAGGEVMFISTPKGFNHFYDLYNMEARDKDFKSFHFTTYDNPFIPKEEIEKMKAEQTEDQFAQESLADFRKTEGLVYKEFDRNLHLFDDDTERKAKIVERTAGIDFGFNHPCAVIHIERDKDGCYWVTDEWVRTKRTESQIAEYVKSCRFNRVYPDPENPSAVEVLNEAGIPVMEVIKGRGSVQVGINKVRELFKQNRLRIHKRCRNLILELEMYSYKDGNDESNFASENPAKVYDDALDALRYGIIGSFELTVRPEEEEQAERLLSRLRSDSASKR